MCVTRFREFADCELDLYWDTSCLVAWIQYVNRIKFHQRGPRQQRWCAVNPASISCELNREELVLIARQHNLSVTPLPPAAAAAALSGLIFGCFASVDFVIAFLFKDFQIMFSAFNPQSDVYVFRVWNYLGPRQFRELISCLKFSETKDNISFQQDSNRWRHSKIALNAYLCICSAGTDFSVGNLWGNRGSIRLTQNTLVKIHYRRLM